MTKSLMFISSSDYDSLFKKGVVDMISERSEGGYFEKVFSIHPLAKKTRKILIEENHYLYEFGFDSLWFGSSSKILRYIYAPLYFFIAIYNVRKLVKENHIDIVRSSDPYWAAIVGYFGTLFISTKFVISIQADWDKCHELDTVYGAPKLFSSRKLMKLAERFFLKKAFKIICIRKSLFKYITNQGIKDKQLVYMPHGIELNHFIKKRKNISKSEFKIISFAGRVSKENFIYDIFEVIKFFKNRKDLKFIIAGDGPELLNLKKLTKKYNLGQNFITYTGFISRKNVADLRISSSINIVLMGGYSLIEASASGNPVVTYSTAWHSEIIKNNVTGKIVKEGDVKRLIIEILNLLENKKLAFKLGKNAQKEVIKNYNLKNVFKQRAKVYSAILGEVYEN
tara:strand:- start:2495 stop:3682 length:1188 start_codon:yes stop_codon:yes gene_type:complete